MFKTKYFLGALAVFTIFGLGVAKAETDDAAVRSGLYYVLQNLQQRVSALTQTAQVRGEEPAALTQSAYYLPQGTLGQTLYHDGSGPASWKATSNLYNNGQIVTVNGPGGSATTTIPAFAVIGGNIMQSNSQGWNLLSGPTVIGQQAFPFGVDKVKLFVRDGLMLWPGQSRPSCSVNYRGTIWYTQGATSDTISACMLTASSTYAWKDL